jgi:hypothetical protein
MGKLTPEAKFTDNAARAEAAYAAMYEAAAHNVKDHYEDACLYLGRAVRRAADLGLESEVERLQKRLDDITAVYNAQFRYVGR